MTTPKSDLPQGTLDLLILKVVALGPVHGYAIAQRLDEVSRGVIQVPEGSLYPALHRLEQDGWIEGTWGESAEGRRVRAYALTAAGKKKLAEERANWRRVATAVSQVLDRA